MHVSDSNQRHRNIQKHCDASHEGFFFIIAKLCCSVSRQSHSTSGACYPGGRYRLSWEIFSRTHSRIPDRFFYFARAVVIIIVTCTKSVTHTMIVTVMIVMIVMFTRPSTHDVSVASVFILTTITRNVSIQICPSKIACRSSLPRCESSSAIICLSESEPFALRVSLTLRLPHITKTRAFSMFFYSGKSTTEANRLELPNEFII